MQIQHLVGIPSRADIKDVLHSSDLLCALKVLIARLYCLSLMRWTAESQPLASTSSRPAAAMSRRLCGLLTSSLVKSAAAL